MTLFHTLISLMTGWPPHPSAQALTKGTLEENGFTQSLMKSVSEIKSYFIFIKINILFFKN